MSFEEVEQPETDLAEQRPATAREAELAELEEITTEYGPALRQALDREAGSEAEPMKGALKAATRERDDKKRAQHEKALRRKYGKLMERAVSASGIDRKAARRRILSAIARYQDEVNLSASASQLDMDLVDSESLGFSLVTRPRPMPTPTPWPTVKTLSPPHGYVLLSTSDPEYAQANPATGAMWARSQAYVAGSFQTLASLGSPFSVDPSVSRIRLEATPHVTYATRAGLIGYASAEAKVNLIVSEENLTEVASDRRSLARSICAVVWFAAAQQDAPVPVSLACEFGRRPDGPTTYVARVEAETWAGGALGSAGAFSYVHNTQNFRALLA
jgi:hypothetical protein